MTKKTLVLGASLKPIRYSNIAIKMLRDYNHEVVAIGLLKGTVKDVEILTASNFEELLNLNIKDVHTITLYLNATRQVAYYDYIISLNPNRVIFNPGTENREFMDILEKNNIKYELACNLVLLRTNQF